LLLLSIGPLLSSSRASARSLVPLFLLLLLKTFFNLSSTFFQKPQVPLFIYAPEEEGQFQPGRCSRWWLRQSLAALSADLERLPCCRAERGGGGGGGGAAGGGGGAAGAGTTTATTAGASGGEGNTTTGNAPAAAAASAPPPSPLPRTSALVLRRSPDSAAALAQVAAETGATALYFNHLYDPISLVRDNDAKAALSARGVAVRSFCGDCLFEPWHVLSKGGEAGGGESAGGGAPFREFEPFWARLRELVAESPPAPPLGVPAQMPPLPLVESLVAATLTEAAAGKHGGTGGDRSDSNNDNGNGPTTTTIDTTATALAPVASLGLDDLGLLTAEEAQSNRQLGRRWTPGSRGAAQRLSAFVAAALPAFGADRAKTDRASTSRLSPHLHWGEVSVRTVFAVVSRVEAALAAASASAAAVAGSSEGGGGGGGNGGNGGMRNGNNGNNGGGASPARTNATAATAATASLPQMLMEPVTRAQAETPATTVVGGAARGGGGRDSGEEVVVENNGGDELGNGNGNEIAASASASAAAASAAAAAAAAAAPAEYFLRQLAFREYARHMCFHFPFTHERALLEHLRGAPWRYDQRAFRAWRAGRTGYPLVDAGMRELWATGWLHNRARVVCACFLVKHLQLPWQWGLKHFWDALLDADLECCALGWQVRRRMKGGRHIFFLRGKKNPTLKEKKNSKNSKKNFSTPLSQYVAGGLPDGLPFGNLLDLEREARRYDPDGGYVRAWLPALARLPDRWIHRPWAAPAAVLADAGVEVGGPDGGTYPERVVSPQESASALAAATRALSAGGGGVGGGGVAAAAARTTAAAAAEEEQQQPGSGSGGGAAAAAAGDNLLGATAAAEPQQHQLNAAATGGEAARPKEKLQPLEPAPPPAVTVAAPQRAPPLPPPQQQPPPARDPTPVVVTASHRPVPLPSSQTPPAVPGVTTASSPSAGAQGRGGAAAAAAAVQQRQRQIQQQQQRPLFRATGSEAGNQHGGTGNGNRATNGAEGVSSNLVVGGGGGGEATATGAGGRDGDGDGDECEGGAASPAPRRRTRASQAAARTSVAPPPAAYKAAANKKKQPPPLPPRPEGDNGGGARKRTRGK